MAEQNLDWQWTEERGGPFGTFICIHRGTGTDNIAQMLWHNRAINDDDRAFAAQIVTAINERERLRRLLRAATSPTKCYCNVMAGNQCWQCEAREVLEAQ